MTTDYAKLIERCRQRAAVEWNEGDASNATHDALREAADAIEALTKVLQTISAIRDDIVGRQAVTCSAHIYPLVAALGEAGFEGVGYDEARGKALTADQECDHLRAELAEAKAEVARAVEAEREACWKLARSIGNRASVEADECVAIGADAVANAIRARGAVK